MGVVLLAVVIGTRAELESDPVAEATATPSMPEAAPDDETAVSTGSSTSTTESAPEPTTTTAPTTTIPAPATIAAPAEVISLSAAGMAEQLSLVERIILDPSQAAGRVAEAGQSQQLLLQRLDTDFLLADQVILQLPPDVRDSVERYLIAGRSIDSLVEPQTSYPSSWRIVAPPSAAELRGYFDEAEAATGIPWRYFAAIASIETRMGRIDGDSSAGAQGPMQFLPSTWEQYGNGGDIRNFRDSVLAASRLLQANGAPRDMSNALFRYNPSSSYVLAVERYAERLLDNERQFLALYEWQVLYKHVDGITLLPTGWPDVPGQIVAPPIE